MRNVFLLIFLGINLFFSSATFASASNEVLNKIIAIVDNDYITESEYQRAYIAVIGEYQQNKIPLPEQKMLHDKVIENLIYQKLQLQLAAKNNITADKNELLQAISTIAKQNHLTLSDLKKRIEQSGIDYTAFQRQIKDNLIMNKLQMQAMSSAIDISAADIAAYRIKQAKEANHFQYHVADLLIPFPENATPSQIEHIKKEASTVYGKLTKGADFNKMAKMLGSASQGTADLGWRSLTDLPDIFSTPLTRLTDNGITEPIQAQNGFHILKLLGKKNTDKSLTDNDIRNFLRQKKFQMALEKWLKNLRKQAYVKIINE